MSNKLLWVLMGAALLGSAPVYCETLRDPTQPMGFKAPQQDRQKLVLQAIYFGHGRKQAVVNGELVNEGSRVSGATITSISSDKVYYRQGGQSGSLSVRPKVSKAAP